jgi:hypothetical protein
MIDEYTGKEFGVTSEEGMSYLYRIYRNRLLIYRNHHYLPVLLSGFVILAKGLLRFAIGFLVILKTGFIMLLIGFEELNPVIPLEFVPVALDIDSAVAFF